MRPDSLSGSLSTDNLRLARYVYHMTNALLFQNALNAFYGVAFAIEQMTNAAQQFHIVRTIITATTAAFHWFDLAKARLPETQHMLRQVQFLRNFADRSKGIRALTQG